ncbi:hypothetical protein LCGC14_2787760, partial [marine sediment metagenome]
GLLTIVAGSALTAGCEDGCSGVVSQPDKITINGKMRINRFKDTY